MFFRFSALVIEISHQLTPLGKHENNYIKENLETLRAWYILCNSTTI